MSLREYKNKRDFKKTREPKAKIDLASKFRFVIQKHAASRLHYDLRLEINGSLKSWAVPKGLPYKKGEKRLAVQVEDHPVSYINFEGTIPQGEYGGGTVMVWDIGNFEPISTKPLKELESGKLHFILRGTKVQGEWYLVRLKDRKSWLLIKGDKDARAVTKKLDDTSAISGKSMNVISQSDEVWSAKSNEKSEKKKTTANNIGVKRNVAPTFIEPMKAKLTESIPSGQWSYEIKYDGYRALAIKQGSRVKLISRNNIELTGDFAEIIDGLRKIRADKFTIDGEICAINEKGISSFQLLQKRMLEKQKAPLLFYAFDLINLDGQDFRSIQLQERRAKLQKLLSKSSKTIHFSQSLEGDVDRLLKQAEKLGLEGLIGKRPESLYEVGKRSGAWIKLKLSKEQEFVIGGYSQPSGSREKFGALLIGYYKKKKLHFAGKVGTGFNRTLLQSLFSRFKKIRNEKCPFENLPEARSGRYGSGVTKSEMKRCTWLSPTLVCQVKFNEWTSDGKLRQPVFLSIREDKSAGEVVREIAE